MDGLLENAPSSVLERFRFKIKLKEGKHHLISSILKKLKVFALIVTDSP
jgi:hypothetical protein